jgi:hypothetical protein
MSKGHERLRDDMKNRAVVGRDQVGLFGMWEWYLLNLARPVLYCRTLRHGRAS